MAEDNAENNQESVEKESAEKELAESKVKNTLTEDPGSEEESETREELPVEEINFEEDASPELLKQIRNQIEFYFGDVNMQRDKFLIEQTKLDEGWIPMTVMLKFKLLSSLSKNIYVILKSLEDSELMEISEDKKKIRRSLKHPLPVYNEKYRKAQEERTVYAKGFPQTDMTVMKLKAFLESYEPIENIIMRKYKDKNDKNCFRGSIFVQFKTLNAAKAFMEVESIKYEDTELIRKWVKDYAEDKAKEKEERRQKKDKKKSNENNENKSDEKEEEKEEEKKSLLPKGSIIHISGLTIECTREDIKDELTKLDAYVAFIEYSKGNPEAWVRLQGEDSAQPVLEKMTDNKVTINGTEGQCRILEGEEEMNYLAKVEKQISDLRRNKKDKRGGRKGGRGGKKRGHSPQRDGQNKKTRH